MRTHLLHTLVISAGILGLAATAQAETTGNTGLTANVGLTSNYVFRGETQTNDDPAVQGGIDYTHPSGFYAGAWGSNVDFPGAGGSTVEYDLYAGINFAVTQDVKMDVGYIAYNYFDSTVNDNVGTSEVFVGAKYQGFAGYYYKGNAKNNNDYQYFDLRYTMGLPQDFKLTLHYGHRDPDVGNNADDASVRVGKTFSGFDVSLAYTTIDSNSPSDKDHLFLTVTKYFDL